MGDTTKDTKPKTEDLMGYESQIETPAETSLPDTSNADDVQTIINKAVKEVTVDEKTGKYIYPDGIDPVLKAAVAATKSYRDNQSGFTKSQQSLKESEAEVEALQKKLATYTSKSLELTPADKAELDKLRDTDPDAWRTKLNRLETEAKESIKEELDTVTEEARNKASGEFELKRRYKYLDDFNVGRELPITTDMLNDDVPPRITNKLAKNEITFEDYLAEVSEYLSKGKVVSKKTSEKTTDLNKAGGSSTASEEAKAKQGEIDYGHQTF